MDGLRACRALARRHTVRRAARSRLRWRPLPRARSGGDRSPRALAGVRRAPAPRRRRLAPRRSRQAPPRLPRAPATRREFLTLAAGLLASAVIPTSAFALPSPLDPRPRGHPEVRAALRAALEANIVKTKAPAVLRLVFHDAGTYRVATGDGGLNGSVQYELGRPESFGLKRGLGPVKAARDALSRRTGGWVVARG